MLVLDEALSALDVSVQAQVLLLLANYDNKGLLALAAKHLKTSKRSDFESWLTSILRSDKAPSVAAAIKLSVPTGVRLSPRKADLDRWRAVFARNLQDRGVNAVATRQPVRAANRNYRKLWEERAAGRGQLIRQRPMQRTSARALAVRADAIRAWERIARALATSKDPTDVRLAVEAVRYLAEVAPGGLAAARAAALRAGQREAGPPTLAPEPALVKRDRGAGPIR